MKLIKTSAFRRFSSGVLKRRKPSCTKRFKEETLISFPGATTFFESSSSLREKNIKRVKKL